MSIKTLIAPLLLGCLYSCASASETASTRMNDTGMTTNETLVSEVEAVLKEASSAIARQEWSSANILLKRGLGALGDRYVSSDIIDDTGMKLVLADVEERKGVLQTAAHLRFRMLDGRLSLLRKNLSMILPLKIQIVNSVAAEINANPQDLFVTDITDRYPWVKKGKIIWLKGSTNILSGVVFVDDGRHVFLNSTKLKLADRVNKLGEILLGQIGFLPGGLSPRDFALTIRKLAVDPRGYLADAAWLNSVTPHLDDWLINRTRDEQMLRDAMAEPSLIVGKDSRWELRFHYLNQFGGIEAWLVTGNRAAIADTTVTPLLPDRNASLRFPVR